MFLPFAEAYLRIDYLKFMNRIGVAAAAVLMVLTLLASCVDERYALSEDRLNLELTVFQDGVTLPLGSTSKIMLKDIKDSLLANMENQSLLQCITVGEDGEYGIAISDRLDLSDTLNGLVAQIEIPDISISETFDFNLGAFDVSDLKVPSTEYVYMEKFSDAVSVPDFSFKGFGADAWIGSGLYAYMPSGDGFALDFPDVEVRSVFAELKDRVFLPDIWVDDDPISLDDPWFYQYFGAVILSSQVKDCQQEVSYSLSVPEGFASVEDIVLGDSSRLRLTVELVNSIFTEGEIVPHIDVDVHELFGLVDQTDGSSGYVSQDHIVEEIVMDAAGGQKVVKEYRIGSLAISPDECIVKDGVLTIEKNVNVTGWLTFNDVKTTTRHLAAQGKKKAELCLKFEVVDFQVEDAKLNVGSVAVGLPKKSLPFSQSIRLPDSVLGVDYMTLSDDSRISVSVVPENMIPGLEVELESLVLTFPDGIDVEGAQNGVLTYEDVSLSDGMFRDIKVNGIDVPDAVNGNMTLGKEVSVEAVVKAGGYVMKSCLPISKSEDFGLKVAVQADLNVSDYGVSVAGYEHSVGYSQQIELDLAGVGDFGAVAVIPQGNPEIVVDFVSSASGVKLVADPEEDLVMAFPRMLRFKDLPQEYRYDREAGTITLKGELPSRMVLPLERILVSSLKDEFRLSGGVAVPAGHMTKDDVEALASQGLQVGVSVRIPEIRFDAVASDHAYEIFVDKKYEVGVLPSCALLDQIVSVDRVELEDAYFTMSLDASQLAGHDTAGLALDFEVTLPEMIVLDSDDVKEGNVLCVRGELGKDGMVKIDPVRIAALDLSHMDMSDPETLKDTVSVTGKVAMDINDWLGKTLEVKLDAGIKDIKVSKFLGKLDLHIPSVETTLDLTPYKESLQNDNFEIEGFEHLLSSLDLAAEIKTNIGIPMGARLVVTPYSDGRPDEENAWSEEITIGHSESASDTTYTRFGLSLKDIPDSLNLVVEIGSDPSQMSVIEPMSQYVVEVAYSLAAPFEFGEGTVVTYRDTIPDVPEEVGQFLAMGDLVLTGELTSNLPLSISVKVHMLDADGRLIELDETAAQQKIEGCSPDGEPVLTEVYFGLKKKDGTEVEDVSAVELEFDITPVAGMSLSDKCYVQAVLQALVPEGISVDLKQLMESKDE